jgi:hypothetical protein
LACFGVFSRLLRELEVHISFLHGGEGRVAFGGGEERGPNCVEALASNTLLEPKDLEALGKGFNSVFPKVIVVVVLCHMEGYILVEVKVPPVAVILERLESCHNGASGRHQLLAAQEVDMKNPKRLASILGLRGGRARVGPGLRSSPGHIKDVIYLGRVLDKGWVKGSMLLKIIQWPSKLGVDQVISKDRCASSQLSVNCCIGTIRIVKGRWIFRSIFRRVVGSFELRANHILEGESGRTPALGEMRLHLSKRGRRSCGHEGHLGGIGLFRVVQAILKGLLSLEVLDILVIVNIGQVIHPARGAPHVLRPKYK